MSPIVRNTLTRKVMLMVGLVVAGSATAMASELDSLTVCADPGNMPLSNKKGEGFENKIAELIGKSLGTGVQYYWRPSIERGLMRTTLSAGDCDLWMDMGTGTEGAVMLQPPLYRSTFVLVYRNDRGYHIKSLDDPILKKLSIGVFQVSAARQALAEHDIFANTVIHYLSHNADLVPANQPSNQIQQVINGKLDMAAAWGPMAGYFRTVKNAPITIQYMNMMDDHVPLEFDMALAVPRGRTDVKHAVTHALEQNREQIKKILTDYGVPLVKCSDCVVSGDLPSHGPYKPMEPSKQQLEADAQIRKSRLTEVKKWLAEGADPNKELNDAIVANDLGRVQFLLEHGAKVDARDGDGNTALINATRFGYANIARYLLAHNANVHLTDLSKWTPLMYAAWTDQPEMVKLLVKHGAKLDARDSKGLTPLSVAAENAKLKAAAELVKAGANVNEPVAKGGYTPLMLAAIAGSHELAQTLIQHGAKVNASNAGGVTALMIAAAHNFPSVAELLIKSGAEVDAHSTDGRTALSIAQANNSHSVVKLLQAAGAKPDMKTSS